MSNNKTISIDLSLKNYYQKSKLAKENKAQINEKDYFLFLKDILKLIRENRNNNEKLHNIEEAIFHELDLNLFDIINGNLILKEHTQAKINTLSVDTLKILKNQSINLDKNSLTVVEYATQDSLDNESELRQQGDDSLWDTIIGIVSIFDEDIEALETDKQNTLVNGNYTTVTGNTVNVDDSSLGTQINTVQTGYGLLTTSQTIIGAINEVKGGGVDPSIYQLKTDNTLATTDKTVVGAINELKASGPDLSNYYDKPSTDGLLAGKQNTLTNGNYTTVSSNQVNVTDDALGTQINTVQNDYSLATTAQTVKGAIEEVVENLATTTTQVFSNTSDMNLKQNVTDSTLNTTSKTVPGAVNEIVSSTSALTTIVSGKQNTLVNGNYTTVSGNTVNVTSDILGTQINTVQNNYGLTTTAQTVKGAIGELVNDITVVSTSINTKQNTLTNGNYTTVSGNQVNVTDDALGVQINTVQNDYSLATTAQTVKGAIGELVGINTAQNINIANNTAGLATINSCVNVATAASTNKKLVANNTALADIANPKDYATKEYVDTRFPTIWIPVGTRTTDWQMITYNLVVGKKYRIRYNYDRNNGGTWTPVPNPQNLTVLTQEFTWNGPTSMTIAGWPLNGGFVNLGSSVGGGSAALDSNSRVINGYSVVGGCELYQVFYTGRLLIAQATGIVLGYSYNSYADQKLGNLIGLDEAQ